MIRVNIILKTGLEQILTPKKIKTQKHKKGQFLINRKNQTTRPSTNKTNLAYNKSQIK